RRAAERRVEREPKDGEPGEASDAPGRNPQRQPTERPRFRPGPEAEQRPEGVYRHVVQGRDAPRGEPLSKLVDPTVGAGEDEGERPRARRGGEGPEPQNRQDTELEERPGLPQADVGGVQQRRAGPGREMTEERQRPLAGPVTREEARGADGDDAHPEQGWQEARQTAPSQGPRFKRHGDRYIQPRCSNVDNVCARLLR